MKVTLVLQVPNKLYAPKCGGLTWIKRQRDSAADVTVVR